MSPLRRAGAALLVLLAACGGAQHPRPRAVLLVEAPLTDTTVRIDDQYVGEIGQLRGGVALPAGTHRVELRHDGYHPRYATVTLAPGERRTLSLTLAEELP